jgi:hypothetical protein
MPVSYNCIYGNRQRDTNEPSIRLKLKRVPVQLYGENEIIVMSFNPRLSLVNVSLKLLENVGRATGIRNTLTYYKACFRNKYIF